MKNDTAEVRAAAVMALGMIGDQSDRERLQVLADDGAGAQGAALGAFGGHGLDHPGHHHLQAAAGEKQGSQVAPVAAASIG